MNLNTPTGSPQTGSILMTTYLPWQWLCTSCPFYLRPILACYLYSMRVLPMMYSLIYQTCPSRTASSIPARKKDLCWFVSTYCWHSPFPSCRHLENKFIAIHNLQKGCKGWGDYLGALLVWNVLKDGNVEILRGSILSSQCWKVPTGADI